MKGLSRMKEEVEQAKHRLSRLVAADRIEFNTRTSKILEETQDAINVLLGKIDELREFERNG